MIKNFLLKIGWCGYCHRFHFPWSIKKRKLNTAYVDEEQNWIVSCKTVYEEAIEYYKERWDDYYSGLL